MTKNALIIFTRNAELGKVKTRLAKSIGDNKALTVYKHLLKHTEKESCAIEASKTVYYSVQIFHNDIWDDTVYTKELQRGTDLGERMLNAFKDQFEKGFERVIIIGTDLPKQSSEIIEKGFEILKTHDIVLGPAQDGGYYLLGMNRLEENLFKNKSWSSDILLKETILELTNKNLNFSLLETLNDIDTFEDLKEHPELLKLI
jgi:rSAM/selenodomain-associated transferase 1